MTTKNIYTQLLLAQAKFDKIEKDSVNPHLRNRYASLSNILNIVLPILQEHDILLTSSIGKDNPEIFEIKLIHTLSDTYVTTNIKLLNLKDMQGWGGCITYATRYGLLSLLGIASGMETDDDGNTAVGYVSTGTKESSEAVKREFEKKKYAIENTPTMSNTERMRLVHDLHELWTLKEGSVRAETDDVKERARRANAIRLFENDLKDITDSGIVALKTWISEL